MSSIDAEFWNGGAASAAQIDHVFARYHSPHLGKGTVIVQMAVSENINPLILAALIQENARFGNAHGGLKPENIANPFAIHFNEDAKGIRKLRLRNGQMATFEQSLAEAIRLLKLCRKSPTPLNEAARYFAGDEQFTWTLRISRFYDLQKQRL